MQLLGYEDSTKAEVFFPDSHDLSNGDLSNGVLHPVMTPLC